MQVSKKQKYFWIFCSISENYIKFQDFENKDNTNNLCISETMCKRRG